MLGTRADSKGGIATVINGFLHDVQLEKYEFEHVVTHVDGSPAQKIFTGAQAFQAFKSGLSAGSYDLVHIHSSFGMSFTRSVPFINEAAKRGVPTVNHIHANDWDAFYSSASERKKRQISEVYGMCTKLIALSEEWADTFKTVVPPDKIEVLENFTPIYEEDFWPSQKQRTVVFMSRLEPIKGCEDLPDIICEVLSVIPDATFLICGEGSMRPALESWIAERGLSENVHLLGWVDEGQKIDVLKCGSVFLLPSYGEGMPMCILEAMGLGLPVVATDVGGIPRIVKNGENGFLCKAGEVQELANSLVRVLTDEVLYNSMSKSSKRMAEGHSIPMYSRQLESLYDRVLQEQFSESPFAKAVSA